MNCRECGTRMSIKANGVYWCPYCGTICLEERFNMGNVANWRAPEKLVLEKERADDDDVPF